MAMRRSAENTASDGLYLRSEAVEAGTDPLQNRKNPVRTAPDGIPLQYGFFAAPTL